MSRLVILLPAFGLGLVAFAVARIVEAPPTIAGIVAGGVCLLIAGIPTVRGLLQGRTAKERLNDPNADAPPTGDAAVEPSPARHDAKGSAPVVAASTTSAPAEGGAGTDSPSEAAASEPAENETGKASAAEAGTDGVAEKTAAVSAGAKSGKAAAPGGARAADDVARRIADPAIYDWLAADPDPELWHIILWSLEWDKGPDPVFCNWVVARPECDRATAADLFLAFSGPDLVGLTEGEARERFPEFGEYVEVIVRICERCANGGYPISRFRPNFLDWEDADLPKWREDLARANPGPDQPDRLQAPVSLLEKDFPSREPRSDYEVRDGMIVRRQSG